MHPAEVVVHVIQGDGMAKVLNLLAESIRQAGEAPHRHPHREILPLDIAG
jgi:hypothetical protein